MAERVVLIVDDDPPFTKSLAWSLRSAGCLVLTASDVAGACELLRSRRVDAALIDLYLPDGSGLEVLASARQLEIVPPLLIMMTARADVRGAVDAMRRGASDFLEKPLELADITGLLERLSSALQFRHHGGPPDVGADPSVARSAAFRDVLSLAARVASTPASSALLLGESGVGKELVATRIHALSERRDGPFVRVNLAAIPATMVEAELFGSVRGAFTDAKRDRAGHFASAEGGTILLDEICEFKMELQSKLLRALEERRFFPVGSDRERRIDARVLAATNRDPKEMIARGLLREDLYYRIATVTIRVPPLRDRPDDIIPLAEHFCKVFGAEFGKPGVQMGAAARAAVLAHAWPGNIRELRNAVERAVMLADTDEISALHLDLVAGGDLASRLEEKAGQDEREGGSLEQAEREHIERVLRQVGGSRTRAASILGIARSTLWEKTKRPRLG
jgi:two-component system, NtrC family, response regulator AtoC